MDRRIISAAIPINDSDIIEIGFSDGSKQREILFYPDGELPQLDSGVLNHSPDIAEFKIIDFELERFAREELGFEKSKSQVKFTKADINGVKYAIDILHDQIGGGSLERATVTNINRLKRLLIKLQSVK